ncbi:beta-ketoacyl-ACP synthase II [Deltaproteobacteria bacterium]|nr:beta-ketoacyl-ACP synthase II [Deltaproteobacteria bacterium]
MKRVVVTGMGVVTPLGCDAETVYRALLEGESGVVAIPAFAEVADLGVRIGGPVRGFEAQRIPRKYRRSMSRMVQYAVSAATDAIAAAAVPVDLFSAGRVAICAGSTTGSPDAMEEFFREYLGTGSIRGVSGTSFLRVMSHTVPAHLALVFGSTGPVHTAACACAISNQAVGMGLDLLRLGRADVALCGGADELSVLGAATFDLVAAAARGWQNDPSARPAPFDRSRDGVVVAEGAAMLVLETLEHALARGAPILAEILGYGESCDATHMSSPEPAGMRLAMERALVDAGVVASDIDYVNAHATGTVIGDLAEAQATGEVFGDGTPVSSFKGHFGHTLAACGGIELAMSILAMRHGVLPPTRNLRDPDVVGVRLFAAPLVTPVRRLVSNNFAFGGINASVVAARWEG